MPRRKKLRVERNDPVAKEIQAVLEDDLAQGAKLMQPAYRPYALKHHSLDGYCAAATAAYFHLEGGLAAGLQPMQLTHRHGSHWWIVKGDGTIIDFTLRQRDAVPDFRYDKGTPRGFTNAGYRKPPKRAAEIMRRVRLARKGLRQ